MHVYLRHPVVSPTAIEAMMRVLRRAVPDEDAARRAYAAIRTYTIGFAALEASRAGWTPSGAEGERVAQPAGETPPAYQQLPASETKQMAEQLAAYTTPRSSPMGCTTCSTASNTVDHTTAAGKSRSDPRLRATTNPAGAPEQRDGENGAPT